MRKIAFLSLFLVGALITAAQNKTELTNDLLKELSASACSCIDSISSTNKLKEEVSAEIAKCIDEQIMAYQVGLSLINAMDEASNKSDTAKIDILINTDKNSSEYRELYYQIERYLMDNCTSLSQKAAAADLLNRHSISENKKAYALYEKGQREFSKENYKKAISYFQKAVREDSLFAFAWDNMGLSYRLLGDYEKAIESYAASLRVDPHGIMPLQNIAVAYRYAKQPEKAVEAYHRLAEIDTNNAETYYGLALVYIADLQDLELGLDNVCKAYAIYVQQRSPYRADAEKVIGHVYNEMKKQNKEERFVEILKRNNIHFNNSGE